MTKSIPLSLFQKFLAFQQSLRSFLIRVGVDQVEVIGHDPQIASFHVLEVALRKIAATDSAYLIQTPDGKVYKVQKLEEDEGGVVWIGATVAWEHQDNFSWPLWLSTATNAGSMCGNQAFRQLAEQLEVDDKTYGWKSILDFVDVEDRYLLENALYRLFSGVSTQEDLELRCIHGDLHRWFRHLLWTKGDIVHGILVETTGVQSELRRNERRLRQLLDFIPVGIFETDLNGGGKYANRAWSKLTGLPVEAQYGMGWKDVIYPEDREKVTAEFIKCTRNLSLFEMCFRYLTAHGEPVLMSVRAMPRSNDITGQLEDWVGTVQSVSEDLLRQAEVKSNLKTQLMATVSHEIRTPLNGLIGILHTFPSTETLNDDQQETLTIVNDCSNQLMAIVNDFLDFSKLDVGQLKLLMEPVHIRLALQGIQRVFFPQCRERGLDLLLEISDNVPAVINTDPVRLRQIILNLLSNAIKFSDTGKIQIKVWRAEGTLNDGSFRLHFAVRDSGIGIQKSQMEALFKPFSQVDSSANRRAGGTGLGLVICKNLVELFQGSISIDSEIGRGTCMSFYIVTRDVALSLPSPATTLSPPTETPEACGTRAESILIVEDNLVNQKYLARLLVRFGFHRIDYASDGKEGVDKVLARPADDEYSLILMDLQMPRLDGYCASQIILTHKPCLSIVCITGDTYQGIQEKCLAIGIREFLLKPFVPDDLQRILATLLPAP
ncbi:hypothetical protein BJ742DRAFT_811524 [Cladochytrium replicatum]|nr:hypothetical protein BJ742DRAFT_811524 [Cladochytrium replicatum]